MATNSGRAAGRPLNTLDASARVSNMAFVCSVFVAAANKLCVDGGGWLRGVNTEMRRSEGTGRARGPPKQSIG